MADADKVTVPVANNPIDSWLDAENAEATQLIANSAKETDGPPVEEPPATEPVKPAETPPATPPSKEPEKPAETPPPATEPVAARPPEEDGAPKDGKFPWKAFRDGERERKQLGDRLVDMERQLEEIRRAPAREPETPLAAPADEVDPFTKTENDIAALRAQIAERDNTLAIQNEEAAFRTQKPDYDQATNYLLQSEAREWNSHATYVMAPRMLADPASLAGIRQMRRDPAKMAQLGDLGERLGIEELKLPSTPTDTDVARVIGLLSVVELRRQALVAAARGARRTVPDLAYEISGLRGYRTAAAPAATVPASTPQERMAREKEKSEIAESLQSIPGSGAPPQPTFVPRTREELAAYMKKTSEGEYNVWQEAMDARDPQWMQRLV